MNKWLVAICMALVGSALVLTDADAARLGGSRSVGAQRSITSTPPAAVPARPAQQQAGQQNAAPAQGAAGQPAPAPSGLSRWAPMLGGLALGGILGAMFGGHLGGLLPMLMVALLAIAAIVAVRAFMGRRAEASPRPMQYAGLGRGSLDTPPPSPSGFDSRASAAAAGPVAASSAGNVPAGFDVAGFLRGAKMNFVRLQVANDAGNLDEIREMTTPELFESLKSDIVARGGAAQQTDVVTVEADLLEVVTEGDKHWASVRFSGMVREAPGAAPTEFQEGWNLVKPVDGSSGWLLAGIQQMG